jgi:hypothetical protein
MLSCKENPLIVNGNMLLTGELPGNISRTQK